MGAMFGELLTGAIGVATSIAMASLPQPATGATEPPPVPIVFERQVRPILKAHCFQCHGEDGEKQGGIDLRQRRLMVQTGALEKDHLSASELLNQVRSGDMPKKGKPLAPAEVATIERWLAAGAPTARPEPEQVPGMFFTEDERAHWSFRPVAKPAVPNNGQKHPVDAFVAAQMVGQGLNFAPAADRVSLLRRASFDLLGLPPTPEQLKSFSNDRRPDAWPRAVDALLSSPHYGERWGRHWLDAAGYADSNGGGKDSPRDDAWHYRDYVIKSVNANVPWNQFIREQLAGDELARLTQSGAPEVLKDETRWQQVAATGFLRMVPDTTTDDNPDPMAAREQVVADTVKMVSSSLLGLTVGCAQCHDHRFDPISHTDYFRLRALFEPFLNPSKWRSPKARAYPAYRPEEDRLNKEIEARAAAVDKIRTDLIAVEYAKYLEERLLPLPEAVRGVVRTAWMTEGKKRSDEQRALLKKYNFEFGREDHLRFLQNREEQEKERVKLVAEATKIREAKVSRVLMAASEIGGEPPTTHRFHRGDFRQPKEAVPPGELSVIEGAPAIPERDTTLPSSGRRLAYARWLTSGKHPLVARVLVNRFWSHHFARGLAPQLADLGMRSDRPAQGDLLDYLAAEFMESGWDLKAWHKLVMTSRTYMQDNRNPVAEKKDADNVYLARMPLRRLDAETVRDSLLAVAGNLNPEMGGRPLTVARHPQGGVVLGKELSNANNNVVHSVESLGPAAYRRSVYVMNRRTLPLTVLQEFDLPFMSPNCAQRAVTTVAPQALMMLNDRLVLEQADVFARNVIKKNPGDRPSSVWVRVLWQRAYGVSPSAQEIAASLSFMEEERQRQAQKSATAVESTERSLAALCQVVFASNRFLYSP